MFFKNKNPKATIEIFSDKKKVDLSIYVPKVIKETHCDLSFSDKIYLSLKGCALGDFAGQPYEFTSLSQCRGIEPRELYKFAEDATDDTILTCATVKGLVLKLNMKNGENNPYADMYRQYAKKYPNPLGGYGPRFETWVYYDKNPKSCGNGSAMRVGPCGCLYALEDVIKAAYESAVCTHSHPEGIKGAIVTAVCIWMAFQGYSKKEIKSYAADMYYDSPYSPKLPWKKLIEYQEVQGDPALCQITVPMAISCFVNSRNYEDCILKAIQFGWDTDTQAAIAGSLAGAYYRQFGAVSEEKWKKLKKNEYIKHIVESLSFDR